MRTTKKDSMQQSLFADIVTALQDLFHDTHAMIMGVLLSFVGYILPVKNIVHLLIVFFILDVLIGYWAAHKLRSERFSVKIIWSHTMPRMFISIVMIVAAFMWDKVYAQELVCTYKVIGWFISGVLLYSIAENGYQITNWNVFKQVGDAVKSKTKESTGLEIEDNEKSN